MDSKGGGGGGGRAIYLGAAAEFKSHAFLRAQRKRVAGSIGVQLAPSAFSTVLVWLLSPPAPCFDHPLYYKKTTTWTPAAFGGLAEGKQTMHTTTKLLLE